jgi:Mrp family chromosome partitioning ATPase
MQIFKSFSIGLSLLLLPVCGMAPLYATKVAVQMDRQPVFDITDAPLISDGAVYVTQAGGTAVQGVRASIRRISSVNGHILGVAHTKADGDTNGYRLRHSAEDEARG